MKPYLNQFIKADFLAHCWSCCRKGFH